MLSPIFRLLRSGARQALILVSLTPLTACDNGVEPAVPCTFETETTCWTHLGAQDKWILSVFSGSAGVFAGTRYDGIWALSDRSWRRSGLAQLRVPGIVAGNNGAVLFAATGHATETHAAPAVVHMTSNGGVSWQTRDDGVGERSGFVANGHAIVADPRSAQRLFAAVSNAIIRSDDNGTTWVTIWGNPSFPGVLPLAQALVVASAGAETRLWAGGFRPVGGAFLIYSDDVGATWTTPTQPGYAEDVVIALLHENENRDRLLVGMPNVIVQTSDAGMSWDTVLTTTAPGYVTALARAGGRVFAISDEFKSPATGGMPTSVLGLYSSTDGGNTWSALSPPPPAATGAYGLSVVDENTLLIGTRNGLWRLHFKPPT